MAAALLTLGGGAVALWPHGPDALRGEALPGEEAPSRDGARSDPDGGGQAADSSTPPPLASGAAVAQAHRERTKARCLELWAELQALIKAGRWTEAKDLAARLRALDPAFLGDPAKAAVVAHIDVAILAAERTLQLEERLKTAKLTDAQRAIVDKRLAATAEILARSGNDADLDQLTRHLKRFLLPDAPGGDGGDFADGALKAFVSDRRARRAEDKNPAVADAEAAEKRRLDQLENLRQRDAVGLLDAIHAGLAWLAIHQRDDGSISDQAVIDRCLALKHDPNCLGQTASTGDVYAVAATGLSILAFLDFRDQDPNGWFDPYLGRAIEWLKKQQKPNGTFGGSGQQYANAIALMAMGQAAASTGSEELREITRRGLAWFAAIASPLGGFRYAPNDSRGDLSVTAWVAQACETSRHAGVEIPVTLASAFEIFLRYDWIGDHRFSYLPQQGASGSLAPAGMLLGHLSWAQKDPVVVDDWKLYLSTMKADQPPDLYTLYYGVRVSILLTGLLGEPWRQWTFDLAKKQVHGTSAAGVFPGDTWKRHKPGATIVTALSVLTLEHSLYLR